MQQTQQLVDSYFESATSYWDQLYSEDGLAGQIYQRRRQVTLDWIQQLRLPATARVIDVGCGAGSTAVPLSCLGYSVVGVDRVPAMLQLLRDNASLTGASSRIQPVLGDACELDFPDAMFDVTIALGLLPWVTSPKTALSEMVRVTRAGGYLIVSADNSWRLNYLLDPLDNPVLVPLRRGAGKVLRAAGVMRPNAGVDVQMHSPLAFNRLIRSQRLRTLESHSIGFGPFTILRRGLLSQAGAVRVHNHLQNLADEKFPILSMTGAHFLVLAEKSHTTAD